MVRNRKGFTLIELMIVVVIIGILAAIAIPRFSNVSKNAKQAEAGPILSQLCTLQQSYYQRWDTYAASVTSAVLTGWEEPNARYFSTWAFAAPNASASLTAAGTDAGLTAPSMNCDTRVLTP